MPPYPIDVLLSHASEQAGKADQDHLQAPTPATLARRRVWHAVIEDLPPLLDHGGDDVDFWMADAFLFTGVEAADASLAEDVSTPEREQAEQEAATYREALTLLHHAAGDTGYDASAAPPEL